MRIVWVVIADEQDIDLLSNVRGQVESIVEVLVIAGQDEPVAGCSILRRRDAHNTAMTRWGVHLYRLVRWSCGTYVSPI